MIIEKPKALNITEVYRYLGCSERQADETTCKAVQLCSDEILRYAQPRAHWLEIALRREHNALLLQNTDLQLQGSDIETHLQGCDSCVLLAVTLGVQVDSLLRAKGANDMLYTFIIDSCASVLIEQLAEQVAAQIKEHYSKQNKYTTSRFSPGYGDLPITVQTEMLRLLDASRKIGLTATPTNILVPRKSITAIMGVANKPVTGKLAGCNHCALQKTCQYRKEGKTCAK